MAQGRAQIPREMTPVQPPFPRRGTLYKAVCAFNEVAFDCIILIYCTEVNGTERPTGLHTVLFSNKYFASRVAPRVRDIPCFDPHGLCIVWHC